MNISRHHHHHRHHRGFAVHFFSSLQLCWFCVLLLLVLISLSTTMSTVSVMSLVCYSFTALGCQSFFWLVSYLLSMSASTWQGYSMNSTWMRSLLYVVSKSFIYLHFVFISTRLPTSNCLLYLLFCNLSTTCGYILIKFVIWSDLMLSLSRPTSSLTSVVGHCWLSNRKAVAVNSCALKMSKLHSVTGLTCSNCRV